MDPIVIQVTPDPGFPDPYQYPRVIELTDDRSLLDVEKCQRLAERIHALMAQARELQRDLNLATYQREATKIEFFRYLEGLHPAIHTDAAGTKFMVYNGRVYYVGWNDPTLAG